MTSRAEPRGGPAGGTAAAPGLQRDRLTNPGTDRQSNNESGGGEVQASTRLHARHSERETQKVSEQILSPSSSSSSGGEIRKLSSAMKTKSSASKHNIVLVTLDQEQLHAVDVDGVQSGAALRERMLSRVHVADDEMRLCTIHWGALGASDDIGDALSDEQLLDLCSDPTNLPNFGSFVVRASSPLAYAHSVPSPALNRARAPSPPPPTGHGRNDPSLSDQLVATYMLSDHPEDQGDDADDPLYADQRVARARYTKGRASDPAAPTGRLRSGSDPHRTDERLYAPRRSADWPPSGPPPHPDRQDYLDGQSRHYEERAFAEERARRADMLRDQQGASPRPNTSSGVVGGSRPPPPFGQGHTMLYAPPHPAQQRMVPPPLQAGQPRVPMSAPRTVPSHAGGQPYFSNPFGSDASRGQGMPPSQVQPQQGRVASYPTSADDARSHYRQVPASYGTSSMQSVPPQQPYYVARGVSRGDPRGPPLPPRRDVRLDPRQAPPPDARSDPRLYGERHAVGPRSMTPGTRTAPLPSVAQFPPPQGSYVRTGPGPPQAIDPRRMGAPHMVMNAPPLAASHSQPGLRSQPVAGSSRGPPPPPPSGPLIGPGMGRPPPELLAGSYQVPTRPSSEADYRSVRSVSAASPAPHFDASKRLALQPGEVLQDALAEESRRSRPKNALPRIQTNQLPSEERFPPDDRRQMATEPVSRDFARRPSAGQEAQPLQTTSRRPSTTSEAVPPTANRQPSPQGKGKEAEIPPSPASAAGHHTPTSSGSSSTSDRLRSRPSGPPAAMQPIHTVPPKRTDETRTSSPRRSEDDSSVHTFSSGRPSSGSSQTSVESPILPPPPACPAAPSAPELWEDDVDAPSVTTKWVSPDAERMPLRRSSIEGDDGSGTARQGNYRLRLDLGNAHGSLGILDTDTLRAAQAPSPAPMPSDNEFADDFEDDIDASTWQGPRRPSAGDLTARGSRPTLTLQIKDSVGSEQAPPSSASRTSARGQHSAQASSSERTASTMLASANSESMPRREVRKMASRPMRTSPVQRRPTIRADVRPSEGELFKNLDAYFPNIDLDKPILVDTSAASTQSPSSPHSPSGKHVAPPAAAPIVKALAREARPSRAKSIRTVATDRAKLLESKNKVKEGEPAKHSSILSGRLHDAMHGVFRRKSAKLWGTKIEEVTPAQGKTASTVIHAPPAADAPHADSENFSFKWVKGELIGKGSYGRVFIGFNITSGDFFAVKQVELPKTSVDREDDRQTGSLNALKYEIETLKDLDHPRIVQYLGFEQTADHLSIFLEYVPGGSVGRWVRKFGKFEESVVQSFTNQILDGLAYLHASGILHRDLKADNCLVDLEGNIRISDFGISKRSNNVYEANEMMSMQGSIFWMAPEVVHNAKKGYSAKVDIWSLGCVVLEMFAGRRPWDTEMAIAAMFKIGAERLAPPVPEDVTLSPPADAFLRRCFIVDPEERPTAEQLMQDPLMKLDPSWTFRSTALGKVISKDAPPTSSTASLYDTTKSSLRE